jgi:hypothetical protein
MSVKRRWIMPEALAGGEDGNGGAGRRSEQREPKEGGRLTVSSYIL